MAKLQENYSLKPHNSFGVEAHARYFFSFSRPDELAEFAQSAIYKRFPKLILGGGSNWLFTRNFEGIVLYPKIFGKKIVAENSQTIRIEAGAGENWDTLVDFAVKHGWGGIENLSLIPGNVGAAPVQNIGAYGTEVSQGIVCVKGFDTETLQSREYSHKQCRFGYRSSLFKEKLKNRFLISSVVFEWQKKPVFRLEYGSLAEKTRNLGEISLKNVRRAVIEIRRSKLPDPEIVGNAGSFFKNPVVETAFAQGLKEKHPQMPVYPVSEKQTKIAAGWLIEHSGWKGKSFGNAGVHHKQALVLVNCGNATGAEILALARKIQQSVAQKFGIRLSPEVNIL